MKTNYCLCASVIFLIVSVGCATSDRPYSPSDLTGVKQVPSRATKTAYRKQSVSQNQVRNSASAAGYYIVKPGDTLSPLLLQIIWITRHWLLLMA